MNLKIQKISVASITFSAVVISIGFYAWRTMFNNFAVEIFNATPTDAGIIQAAREIPGLLAFGVGMLALWFAESKISAISIIVLGVGLVMCGMSNSILMLTMATVLMSFGFHYFHPTNSSQLLLISKNENLGKAQGKLSSYSSLAGLIGAGLIMFLTLFLDYRMTFYIMGGGVILIGAYLVYALPSNRTDTDERKIKLKKKYWLYYTLSFLRGCRRHIFTTFAIFLLVKNHELNITLISGIMLANNFITIFTNRYLGYLSDKLGEKTILVTSSLILVFIFAGYAYVSFLPVLIGLYLIDNMLFGSSIALKSYLKKISTSKDITGCLSFGMTANHITAVIIPIVGGILWSMFGYEITFLMGALIVFIDMLFALRIPKREELNGK
ncbi:MAG: MFS transporter [candidate division Zixibacteria bacterium]|nr:MFS transporter [candidate division Zixibacteria bacterium]